MKVLISDNLSPIGEEILTKAGIEVDVNTGLPPEELKKIISAYDGLVIRSATKVTEEIIETEKPWDNAVSRLEKAIGFQASRNLPKGRILTAKFLKEPALGTKGDKILILAQKGAMKITTPGILKEDGYEDSMVQVLNIETKKLIYGRLIDANTVKVSF